MRPVEDKEEAVAAAAVPEIRSLAEAQQRAVAAAVVHPRPAQARQDVAPEAAVRAERVTRILMRRLRSSLQVAPVPRNQEPTA